MAVSNIEGYRKQKSIFIWTPFTFTNMNQPGLLSVARARIKYIKLLLFMRNTNLRFYLYRTDMNLYKTWLNTPWGRGYTYKGSLSFKAALSYWLMTEYCIAGTVDISDALLLSILAKAILLRWKLDY